MAWSRRTTRWAAAILGAVLVAVLSPPVHATAPEIATAGPNVLAPELASIAAAQPAAPRSATTDLSSYTAGGLVPSTAAPGPAAEPVPAFGQVGNCTFYATPSQAGGYCISALGNGRPQSLREWLDGRPFVYCRYENIPEGMALKVKEKPGGRWLLKICIQDVDFSQPWGGRDTHLEVYSQWVEYGREIRIPPHMEQFWDVQDQRNYYPLPRIMVGPTQQAIVNTYTYYWPEWVESFDVPPGEPLQETEPRYRVPYILDDGQRVYLIAEISDLVFYPGRPAMQEKHCGDATTEFRYDIEGEVPVEEGGTQPSRCWFIYDHSSANGEKGTVRVRATAHWQVRVEYADGSVALRLADQAYQIAQRVVIAEVQSNVDSDTSDW